MQWERTWRFVRDWQQEVSMALSGIEPRRMPMQARSRERVDRILDAAAQLLIEEGYDAVKTNHIAKRAGVSIGSIYQFYPNRYAIFHALAVRYMDRISDILSGHMGPDAPERPWPEVIDEVIDILAEMWRTEPAFLAVWSAIQHTPELRESDEHYSTIFVNDILANYLQTVLPLAARQRRQTIARIVFEISQRLLDHSMQCGPEQDDGVIEELKLLMHAYLSAHVQLAADGSTVRQTVSRGARS
jgi:AcrR family transcriptional regulator